MPHLRRFRCAALALVLAACGHPSSDPTGDPAGDGDAGPIDHWVHQDAGHDATTHAPLDAAADLARDAEPVPDAADPCAGTVCDTPPARACADAQTLTVYEPTGACAAGQCHYTSSTMACPGGCAGGACLDDPCAGVTCRTPPANTCSDESHLTAYETAGACSDGACTYPSHESYCAFGCVAGACQSDPCAGKDCSQPPASYCKDANTLLAYEAPGACSDGTCSYSSHDVYCGFGCLNGACKGDPCAGKSCTTPPARDCKDADTARTYASPGTCTDGLCSYRATETACPFGCANGVCKDCAGDADCGAGRWCNASTCAACSDTAHCGPTCAACSGTTPACGGASAGCQCAVGTTDSCGAGSYCSGGMCRTCDSGACGDGRCDCGESTSSCPADCGAPCPAGLVIGAWSTGDDGWSYPTNSEILYQFWRRSAGYMGGGNSIKFNSSYTQDLTYGADLDLASCSSATLSFSVSLSDDSSRGSDKSERLYVQCSGDGGATWTSLTPNPWPAHQSGCNTSYCNGDTNDDRSFNFTAQSIALPAQCRTAKTRFRFEATGKSAWNMQNPGWLLKGVTIN